MEIYQIYQWKSTKSNGNLPNPMEIYQIYQWYRRTPIGLTDDMLELYGLHDLRLEVEQWALEKNKPALVTVEVRFPLSYPSLPPFVRIITPRFAFHTGHITVGGSVCAEFLITTGSHPR